MTEGRLHPADEKAMRDLWDAVVSRASKIPRGGELVVSIYRESNGRISPNSSLKVVSFPLRDPESP